MGGRIAVRSAVLAVDDVAEAFQLVGGADPVWGRFGAEAWWQAILGIFLQHWAVQRLADAPGVGEIPALELFLIGEIADGGCAGCLTAADAGYFWILLQEIAVCDAAGVDVTPNNAADCAVNIFAEFSSGVAVCNAAVVGVAPNDAAKDALNGKRFIVASDVTGAVAVCDAAVVSVVPNNTAEIAVKKTLGWGSV